MSEQFPHEVQAVIWEPVGPVDRGDRYEDPLIEHLEKTGSGKFIGAGTALNSEGDVSHVELRFELADLGDALAGVKALLESQGAPFGSVLRFERDGKPVEEPLGALKGLFAYLTLDESAIEAAENESEEESEGGAEFVDQLREALERSGVGEMRRADPQGETLAVYFYGPDAGALRAVVEPILQASPIVKETRYVVRDRAPESFEGGFSIVSNDRGVGIGFPVTPRVRLYVRGLVIGCLLLIATLIWGIVKGIAWLFSS